MKKLREWLRDKRGSPLVEEALLLGIAAITLSIVLSMIAGFLSSVQGVFDVNLANFDTIKEQLKQAWETLIKFFRLG